MSRASMGVPAAAASSNAPLCPSDSDVLSTAVAWRIYATIRARVTPGRARATVDRSNRRDTSTAYASSSEGPTTATRKGGERTEAEAAKVVVVDVDDFASSLIQRSIRAASRSAASTAHRTSFTGLSPAGRRNTGVSGRAPSAS